MSSISGQTLGDSTASELLSLIYGFPDYFPDPTGPEKRSILGSITKAWTLVESIKDNDYVPAEMENAVEECLKINHEIKWELAAWIMPKGQPNGPDKLVKTGWLMQHTNCPGGEECSPREDARLYMEEKFGTLTRYLEMIRKE